MQSHMIDVMLITAAVMDLFHKHATESDHTQIYIVSVDGV